MTLLAEELLLLLLDDEKGTVPAGSSLGAGVGVGGALLAELALADAIAVRAEPRRWSSAKVQAVPGAGVEDPVLAEALAVVAEKERSATVLVEKLGTGAKDVLLARLEARGILQRQEDRILGLFPRTRWPAVDSAHEDQVRRQLTAVLAGSRADPRQGALIALLHAMGTLPKVISVPGVSRGNLRRRAKAIAEGEWAAKAVRDAIQATQAAVAAAATAATTAGSS